MPWRGAVHGACFAIHIPKFHQVGGFDESLFLYGEEFDLAVKYESAGMRMAFLVSSSIEHASEGRLDTKKQMLNMYNLRYLAWRERRWILSFVFTVRLLIFVFSQAQWSLLSFIFRPNEPRSLTFRGLKSESNSK